MIKRDSQNITDNWISCAYFLFTFVVADFVSDLVADFLVYEEGTKKVRIIQQQRIQTITNANCQASPNEFHRKC